MTPPDTETIERNKDKLDLKPEIEFVARYFHIYTQGLSDLLDKPVTEESQRFADSVEIIGLESIIGPQVSPDETRRILSVMPESLRQLSKLSSVQYEGCIPVPIYDEEGNFSGKAYIVDPDEFPRSGEHPSRVLVGRSNGHTVFPTPIPKSVSANEEAVKMYQVHVFLHEFFHTIDYPRRDSEKRRAVLLECDGSQFTLQDFWEEFEKLYLREDRKFVSRYAATYADKLNQRTRSDDPARFSSAIGEQVCESFVGYMLGIISNDNDCANFRCGHPEEYQLIDKLCRAKVLTAD